MMDEKDLLSPDNKTPQDVFDTGGLTEDEVERKFKAWCADREREYERLRSSAVQSFRACNSWWGVRTEADWLDACAKALEANRSGRHLIEQMGAERLLDPKQMAHLWGFREDLVADTGAESAGELALVDMAVVAYANVLRVQGWIGNWSLNVEREAFGQKGLRADFKDRYGMEGERINGLRVEQYVGRIADELLPLVERFHRMAREAIRALRESRTAPSVRVERSRPPALTVKIG